MKAFTVYYDAETGEMTRINETQQFSDETTLFRADVLKDIAFAFAARYAEAYHEMMRDFETYEQGPEKEVQ